MTRDPLTPDLIAAARHLLDFILFLFGEPEWFATHPAVWQWWKFDLLDWLRPLEKLLRRLLMIEAIHLALSQQQSRAAPRRTRPAKTPPPAWDAHDPATWRPHFRILAPLHAPRYNRCRNPAIAEHFSEHGRDRLLRYRRVLHDPRPLALRLTAIIRIVDNPLPRIRRLAAGLARTTQQRAARILLPLARPKPPLLTETLQEAGERCAAMMGAYWGSG